MQLEILVGQEPEKFNDLFARRLGSADDQQ